MRLFTTLECLFPRQCLEGATTRATTPREYTFVENPLSPSPLSALFSCKTSSHSWVAPRRVPPPLPPSQSIIMREILYSLSRRRARPGEVLSN